MNVPVWEMAVTLFAVEKRTLPLCPLQLWLLCLWICTSEQPDLGQMGHSLPSSAAFSASFLSDSLRGSRLWKLVVAEQVQPMSSSRGGKALLLLSFFFFFLRVLYRLSWLRRLSLYVERKVSFLTVFGCCNTTFMKRNRIMSSVCEVYRKVFLHVVWITFWLNLIVYFTNFWIEYGSQIRVFILQRLLTAISSLWAEQLATQETHTLREAHHLPLNPAASKKGLAQALLHRSRWFLSAHLFIFYF